MKKNISKIKDLLNCVQFILSITWKVDNKYFVYAIFQVVVQTSFSLLIIIIPKNILNSLVCGNYKMSVIYSVILSILIFLFKALLDFIWMRKNIKEQVINNNISSKLAKKTLNMQYEKFENSKTLEKYEFSKKCIKEGSIGKTIDSLTNILSGIITLLGITYIMSNISFWIFMLIAIVIFINSLGEIKRLNYEYDRQQVETPLEIKLYYTRDYIVGKDFAKEVRLFNLYNFISYKTQFYIDRFHEVQKNSYKKYTKIFAWTYVVNFIQMFVIYGYVAYKFINGSISIGDFSMYVGSILLFSSTTQDIIQGVISIVKNNKYVRDLRYFMLQEDVGSISNKKSLEMINDLFTIEFRNVFFKYPNSEEYTIKNLNLIIKSNDKISIVGENGAGKTTFIKLLMGLYSPTSGEILINGKNIKSINYDEYISLFSTVFQDFNVLGFTISENVSMMEIGNSKEVNNSLKEAGLFYKVDLLKDKSNTYMTKIFDEDGIELSGGEKQKLAIARALYKNAPIYILDEPTAAFSPQSEYELYNNFNNITKNKTVLYISHRLSSCRFCNNILVFHKGTIIEKGTHEELINEDTMYSKMFNVQAQYYKG